jgi:hypothetical protein
MRKFKAILLIASVVVFGFLTSCGKNEEDESSSNSNGFSNILPNRVALSLPGDLGNATSNANFISSSTASLNTIGKSTVKADQNQSNPPTDKNDTSFGYMITKTTIQQSYRNLDSIEQIFNMLKSEQGKTLMENGELSSSMNGEPFSATYKDKGNNSYEVTFSETSSENGMKLDWTVHDTYFEGTLYMKCLFLVSDGNTTSTGQGIVRIDFKIMKEGETGEEYSKIYLKARIGTENFGYRAEVIKKTDGTYRIYGYDSSSFNGNTYSLGLLGYVNSDGSGLVRMKGSFSDGTTTDNMDYKEAFNSQGSIVYYYHDFIGDSTTPSWQDTSGNTVDITTTDYSDEAQWVDNDENVPTTYEPSDNDWGGYTLD